MRSYEDIEKGLYSKNNPILSGGIHNKLLYKAYTTNFSGKVTDRNYMLKCYDYKSDIFYRLYFKNFGDIDFYIAYKKGLLNVGNAYKRYYGEVL